MKLKYILSSLFAAAAIFAACSTEEPVSKMTGLEVSNDYITLGSEENLSTTITVTGDEDWTLSYTFGDKEEEWLTVTPASGAAGQAVTVTITAAKTADARSKEVHIAMGSKVKIVTVNQEGNISPATVKEILEGPDKTYQVTGKVTKITNTHYGNIYINDGTVEGDGVYVYGILDKKGNDNKSSNTWDNLNDPKYEHSWDLAVGDEITVEGPKQVYSGTVELVNVKVLKIVPSLITVDNLEFSLAKRDTVVVAKVQYSGDNLDFSSDASWLNVTSVKRDADTTLVSIHAAANTEDTRTGVITLSSTKGEAVTEINITVTQASGLAAYPLPYEEALTNGFGAWEPKDIVAVEGVASIWTNSDQYGMVAKATKAADGEAELVSPNIDLTGAKSPVLSFEHVSRYAGNVYEELKLYVTKDNGKNWTEVLIPNYSDGKSWSYVPSGSISLANFTDNLIKLKFVYKSSTAHYATWEFKNIKIVDEALSVKNIAEINNSATATEASWSGEFTDAVVSYVNGGNAFIEDATGGIQLYKKDHGLIAGQKISGTVTGKVKLYNGYAELTDLNVTEATVTDGEAPAATVLTVDELLGRYLRYQNCKVQLNGVTLSPALTTSNRNTTVTQGTATIAGYAQIKNTIEIAAGTNGNLVCWPTRYNANLQVGIWEAAHFTAAE